MILIAKLNILNEVTQYKEYYCLGETENYFVIKNDLNKHSMLKKDIFKIKL